MRISPTRTAFAAAFVVVAGLGLRAASTDARAEEMLKIYRGITPAEIVAFAERQGWTVDTQAGPFVLRIMVGETAVPLILSDCDTDDRCASGVIRDISKISLSPKNADFWHWNQGTRKATGFGPQYVTLQRHVHFRGVTEEYLKDVVDEWVKASKDFWPMAKKRYDETAGKPGPKEGMKE